MEQASRSAAAGLTLVLTFLSLLHLESEVECTYGEVDSLRVGLPHGAQQVQDIVPLLPHQARQQLRYPRQPVVGGDPIEVLVHSLLEESIIVRMYVRRSMDLSKVDISVIFRNNFYDL